MPTYPLKQSLLLGALSLVLALGIACGGGDNPAIQRGTEDSTTTTAPEASSTTAPEAPTSTTAKPAATTATTSAPATTSTTVKATTTTTEAPTTTTTEPEVEEAYYANCDAARAAGVAPISKGQPGYRSGLDRDGDGIACDK